MNSSYVNITIIGRQVDLFEITYTPKLLPLPSRILLNYAWVTTKLKIDAYTDR